MQFFLIEEAYPLIIITQRNFLLMMKMGIMKHLLVSHYVILSLLVSERFSFELGWQIDFRLKNQTIIEVGIRFLIISTAM